MKKQMRYWALAMKIWVPAVFAILLLLVLATGCSTTNAGSRTLKQVEMDVAWSMTRFNNGITAGAVTPAEQNRVKNAYENYQAAYTKALERAHNNRGTPAPAGVKALADQLIAAIAAIPF